jgi:D-glycero-alpha-D-manno-heptose 1-phosphate guanylyltransferase
MESIILAGGLGTRLQGVIGAYPKCMAPVNGKPFLAYLFEYLAQQKCTRAILSLGYKHEVVAEWLATQLLPFSVDYVIEQEPLGTGGGIQLAMKEGREEHVVVLNGDTMFQVDLTEQMNFHKGRKAETTLALKSMRHFDRYGVVNVGASGVITSFEEKQYREEGLINGGVYMINKSAFLAKQLPEKFSFEKEYLERYISEEKFFGFKSQGYFIDIGVPGDYANAQNDFRTLFS